MPFKIYVIHSSSESRGREWREADLRESVFLKEDEGFRKLYRRGFYHQLLLFYIQKASRHRRYGGIVHIENADHVPRSDDFSVSYVEVHCFHVSLMSTLFCYFVFTDRRGRRSLQDSKERSDTVLLKQNFIEMSMATEIKYFLRDCRDRRSRRSIIVHKIFDQIEENKTLALLSFAYFSFAKEK